MRIRATALLLLSAVGWVDAFGTPSVHVHPTIVKKTPTKATTTSKQLFASSRQIRTTSQHSMFGSIKKCEALLTTMAVSLLLPQRGLAFAANISRKRIQQAAAAVVSLFLISAVRGTIRVRKRQSFDATSEWGRYASNPAARGRAVLLICIRLLLSWVRQRLVPEKERSCLRIRSGEMLADSLLKLGPLYVKLGQIVSCRENLLPSEWITALEKLQDQVPAKTGQEALELGYAAIGNKDRFEEIFVDFDTTPLAAASLGQVHKAVLRASNETVAIKLQRPLLRKIYDQDLALMTRIAKVMDSMGGRKSQLGGVSQSWSKIFEDAKEILYREIDYRDEADNSLRISNDFGLDKGGGAIQPTVRSKDGRELPSASSWLRIPHVYKQLSSERALVMEYVPSIKITNLAALDFAGITLEDREYITDSLARAYLRSFVSNRFFSTDPHGGNLGVEVAEGKPRLVMYDFGQACALKEDQAEGILDVIEAIVDMNSNRCVDAFSKMGVLKPGADLDKVRAKVRNNFETGKIQVKKKKLKKAGYKFKDVEPSASQTSTEKVKDSEVMSYFTLPAEYAFVARAISQMDGVGKALHPDFDFISSAAPHIVEIKGTASYLTDEWTKRFNDFKNKIPWTVN